MTKTTNYQLPKWEKTDRIQMKDFNDMTATLDAALKANADAITAAAAAQTNCTVVCGTYTGTGDYTADSKNTLTFAGKPMLVIVYAVDESNKMLGLVLVRGANQTYNNRGTSLDTIYISWGANSVSWYEKYDAEYQANKHGTAYAYVALLEKQ